jgi:hypothetical protein
MNRTSLWVVGVMALAAVAFVAWRARRVEEPVAREVARPDRARNRELLLAAVQPVRLANCELRRFGESHDGGYVLCANLLDSVEAGYSYGISGYDGWGCDVSRIRRIRMHEYDCFNTQAPLCPGGETVFHAECVGASNVVDGRPFDTLSKQIARNGDAAKHLVVKMDVEGAEWDALLTAPDAVLEQIDQLAVEFHGTQEDRFIETMRRLSGFFHVASLHFNNFSCDSRLTPFPAWAYEVLLVSKRLGVLAPDSAPISDQPTAPNFAEGPDCQAVAP